MGQRPLKPKPKLYIKRVEETSGNYKWKWRKYKIIRYYKCLKTIQQTKYRSG